MKSAETDSRILIIGYGNVLRGDDGVGCAIADLLQSQPRPPNLEVIRTHQLTPELSERLSHADLAIFVDAACNFRPGEVAGHAVCREGSRSKSIYHHLTPSQLLAYCSKLYGHQPEAWEITVGGEQWGFCDQLSGPVRAAIQKVLHRIDVLLASRATSNSAGISNA